MIPLVKGEDLIGARTLGMQSIEVMDKNKDTYRITTTQVLEILKKFDFSQTKAKKYYYLKPI